MRVVLSTVVSGAMLVLCGCPSQASNQGVASQGQAATQWEEPPWQEATAQAVESVLQSKSEALGSVEQAVGEALLRCTHPTGRFSSASHLTTTEVKGSRTSVLTRLTIHWKGGLVGTDYQSVFLIESWRNSVPDRPDQSEEGWELTLEVDTAKIGATERGKSDARAYLTRFFYRDVLEYTSFHITDPALREEPAPVDVALYHPSSSPFFQ